MLNAASYERVSSDEQAREGFSLEVQREKNVARIHHEGWTFVRSYCDPGKSGKNLTRPDMQLMIQDIESGKIQVIVVHKLDRLTRNVGDLHYLLNLLEKHKVNLVSLNENIDTSNAMGRMFVYMLGIFAQWYRENLSEEVVKGLTKRAEHGLRNTASAPYGYLCNEELQLVIVEEEAQVIRKIYQWRLEGWGRNKIARELNKPPAVPSRTGKQWSDKVIGDVLTNIAYAGSVSWKRREDSREKAIVVHNMHEPIVDMDTFEQVQSIMQRVRDGLLSPNDYDYPFSTITKCAVCGRSFNGKVSQKYKDRIYRGYRCNGVGRANSSCVASEIAETKMERLLLSRIDGILDRNIDASRPLQTNKVDTEKERKRIEKQIVESKERRKKWAKAMGDGKMSYEDYSELVDEEQVRLVALISELEKLPTVNQDPVYTRKDTMDKLRNLRAEWNDLTNEQRKFYVQRIFKRLVIGKVNGKWQILGHELVD